MVKKRDNIAHTSLSIAIDNMGMKFAIRLNREGFKDQEVQSVQNSGASTNKIAEKPLRGKGMEKSVMDDIMGDPDDFGDLGDLDAGSESNGGRWEDTLKIEDNIVDGLKLHLIKGINFFNDFNRFSNKFIVMPSRGLSCLIYHRPSPSNFHLNNNLHYCSRLLQKISSGELTRMKVFEDNGESMKRWKLENGPNPNKHKGLFGR